MGATRSRRKRKPTAAAASEEANQAEVPPAVEEVTTYVRSPAEVVKTRQQEVDISYVFSLPSTRKKTRISKKNENLQLPLPLSSRKTRATSASSASKKRTTTTRSAKKLTPARNTEVKV